MSIINYYFFMHYIRSDIMIFDCKTDKNVNIFQKVQKKH